MNDSLMTINSAGASPTRSLAGSPLESSPRRQSFEDVRFAKDKDFEMADDMFSLPLNLNLKLEPMNPCALCQILKREDSAKLWGYVNLFLALGLAVFKWWVTVMIVGGTAPHLRIYSVVYVLYCSQTDIGLNRIHVGYCFDVISQLLHLVGSIIFFLGSAGFKEFKPRRKLFTHIYISSIVVHIIGAIVPQTLFWLLDGHCIPPGGMSLCEVTEKDSHVIKKGPFKESKSCFSLTHTYFVIVYFSTTTFMVFWWVYGLMMAQSYLFCLKKPEFDKSSKFGQSFHSNRKSRGRIH